MPIFHEAKVVLVQIPKTAGTAIVETGVLGPAVAVGHHSWRWYAHFHPSEWATYTKISVVRDPVERLRSAYRFATMLESYWHDADNAHPDYEICSRFSLDELVLAGDIPMRSHPSFRPQSAQLDGADGIFLVDYDTLNGTDVAGRKVDLPRRLNDSVYRDTVLSSDALLIVEELYAADFELVERSRRGP